jgi:SAM-dependent methyltransferase
VNSKEHWNQVYQSKGALDVSWYQDRPAMSLRLIEAAGIARNAGIIDVGGGASVLVDFLLDAGLSNLAVLDLSANALGLAQQRLGPRASLVNWFVADVTEFTAPQTFGLWHDRAVFHFLTNETDRRKYAQTLARTLAPGGHAIIATFAQDGPLKCSGLDICRYDAASICAELGPKLKFIAQVDETHVTPWHTEQKFSYFHFIQDDGPH